jgi:hypothetical protein
MRRSQQNSGWGNNVLIVWKHEVHVLEWLLHLEIRACHGPTQQRHFPLQPTQLKNAVALRQLRHYMLVCCKGFAVGAKALAGWMSLLSQLVCTPDCMNLVPVLLTWHTTLSSQHPLHKIASVEVTQLSRDTSRKHAQQRKASWES